MECNLFASAQLQLIELLAITSPDLQSSTDLLRGGETIVITPKCSLVVSCVLSPFVVLTYQLMMMAFVCD